MYVKNIGGKVKHCRFVKPTKDIFYEILGTSINCIQISAPSL